MTFDNRRVVNRSEKKKLKSDHPKNLLCLVTWKNAYKIAKTMFVWYIVGFVYIYTCDINASNVRVSSISLTNNVIFLDKIEKLI